MPATVGQKTKYQVAHAASHQANADGKLMATTLGGGWHAATAKDNRCMADGQDKPDLGLRKTPLPSSFREVCQGHRFDSVREESGSDEGPDFAV
jgi:hypothetical protein